MILPICIPLTIQILSVPDLFNKLSYTFLECCLISMFISVLVVVANFFDYCVNGYDNEMQAVYFMHLFFLGLMLFSLLGIGSALKKNKGLLVAAAVLWLVLTIFWLALCCIQFATWFSIPDVCVNRRCPDTFWLSDWYYQAFYNHKNVTTRPDKFEKYTMLNSTMERHQFHENSLYLTGSIISFVSFLFYMAMLGSMVRSLFEVLIMTGSSPNSNARNSPNGLLLFLPFYQFNGPSVIEAPGPSSQQATEPVNIQASSSVKPQQPATNPPAPIDQNNK